MLPISVIDNNSNVLATDLLLSVSIFAEVNKLKISNLAVAAAEELQQMAQAEEEEEDDHKKNKEAEPLWLFDEVQNFEVLNVAEYRRRFIMTSSMDETLEEVIRVITTGGDSLIMDGLPFQNPNYYNCGGKKIPSGVHQTEDASRATAVVYADPLTLVRMLMNVVIYTYIYI